MLEEHTEKEYKEAKVGGGKILLEGYQLGGAAAGTADSSDLARDRFQGTRRMLFIPNLALDQPAVTPMKQGARPSQSLQENSLVLLPNPQRKRKDSGVVIAQVPRMSIHLDEADTMHVASQALISAKEDTKMGTIKSIMKETFSKNKTSRKEMHETIPEQSRTHLALGLSIMTK